MHSSTVIFFYIPLQTQLSTNYYRLVLFIASLHSLQDISIKVSTITIMPCLHLEDLDRNIMFDQMITLPISGVAKFPVDSLLDTIHIILEIRLSSSLQSVSNPFSYISIILGLQEDAD
ncbi:hypothetical protein ACJX0J_028274 [Zea mays]